MFKKKPKAEEPFTPSDLSNMTDKYDRKQRRIFNKISATRSAAELTKTQKWRRRLFWILIALVGVLLIMFIISMLISQYGDLVIGVERTARGKGITVSETPNLEDGVTILSAPKVKDVTNITYSWLPLTELDTKDGSNNGRNYLAYTFYVQNNGSEEVDYTGQLVIKGVSKSADEAARVMVYKNGEPNIYGKAKYKSETNEPEEDATVFESSDVIMSTSTENFEPGDMDRYTVVTWIEGNDPECVNDIMGGFIRMEMLFGIADEEGQGNP